MPRGAILLLTNRAEPTYKTTIPFFLRLLFLLALPLVISSPGSAASLTGIVVDVADGGSVVVLSGKNPLKVRLIAVAALVKNQAYADVARQHLSDLILNKNVEVRYSLLREGYLVGQVMSGSMDVGAQMIRDGVAWYDRSEAGRLSENERQIYAKSQDAAHSERRGLWQDESPVSPWDFRKAQAAPPPPLQKTALSEQRERAHLSRGTEAGLASEDLMGGVIGPGSLAGKPNVKPLSSDGTPGRWIRYQSADQHFSILIPSNGYEITAPVLDDQGKVLNINYLVGNNGRALYFLMWSKGPNGNQTEASIADEAMNKMLTEMNRLGESSGYVVTANRGSGELVSAGR